MGSEQPVPSPFDRSDLPKASAQQPPAPQQPEPPRLGILHLLVLTACVAVYLSVLRASRLAIYEEQSPVFRGMFELSARVLYGIGAGAALGGLVLWAARRLRGWPFPVHPGEYLLALMGIGVVMELLLWLGQLLMIISQRHEVMMVLQSLQLLVNGAMYIWAIVAVRRWHWRFFLLLSPACYLLFLTLLVWIGPSNLGSFWTWEMRLPIAAVLLAVVLKDHFEGNRYPWTHWYGVATRLWLDASVLLISAWHRFFSAS